MVGFVCGGYTPIARMHYDQRAEPGRHWKGEQHHVRRPVGSRAAALDRRHIDRRTRRIDSGEGTAALAGKELVGVGLARLNPADRNVPEIGDELSVARALSDLGKRMLKVSTHDIEAVTHQPARLLY